MLYFSIFILQCDDRWNYVLLWNLHSRGKGVPSPSHIILKLLPLPQRSQGSVLSLLCRSHILWPLSNKNTVKAVIQSVSFFLSYIMCASLLFLCCSACVCFENVNVFRLFQNKSRFEFATFFSVRRKVISEPCFFISGCFSFFFWRGQNTHNMGSFLIWVYLAIYFCLTSLILQNRDFHVERAKCSSLNLLLKEDLRLHIHQ